MPSGASSNGRPAGPPRIVFAGTPEFALISLQALVASGQRPVAVLTQPDRPAGRGRSVSASPVKTWALAQEIEVLQPQTLKDGGSQDALASLRPDVLVVAAYGLILPPAVLTLPGAGCVNVHASLLPRWRGASPIQAAILAGDAITGISLMQMDPGLDTGPVFERAELPIGPEETAGELHDRLAALGGRLLSERLPAILAGELRPQPQPEAGASYAPRIRREDALMDWSRPAAELDRVVRAYNPWPVAHTVLDGAPLRCWRARVVPEAADGVAGEIIGAGARGIDVQTGAGVLRLLEVQTAGRRRIPAADLANQRPLTGRRLG